MSRKCLVLCRRSLLAQGVVSLLTLNPAVEVVPTDLEEEDPIQVFRAVRPEVVMADVSEIAVVEKPFWTFLQENPAVKLVCLDARSSIVLIIRAECWGRRNSQELFAALDDRQGLMKGGKG